MKYFINEDSVVWRNINGEIIVLNLNSGHHYTLNKLGSKIWLLLEKKKSIEEIIQQAFHEFDMSLNQVRDDVVNFLNNLNQENLVQKIE